MTLQVRTIALYSRDGRVRTLDFKQGTVNVITGASSRGKSALIAILEYCFGRSEFKVPEGIITDTVAWYAVVYKFGDTEILVAKPAPEGGAATQSEVHFDTATHIRLPTLRELKPNSNDTALVLYLTRALGIAPNVSIVDEGQTREPLQASLKHTRFYLFQDQGTIANPGYLFHRQSDDFMPQAIRDTLPYFLGVYGRERVKVLADLRTARRELKSAEQRLGEEKRLSSRESRRAWSLLAEAEQAAVLAPGARPTTDETMLSQGD